jgi:hypothetical protein
MCIITLIPGNVEVPWDALSNGGLSNRDGHGWAVASGDRITTGKSMNLDDALNGLEKAVDDHDRNAVVLFHSRIATHGTYGTFNVHPFPVGGREDTVMAHNGILPSRWHPAWKDPRSDTHKYADNLGPDVDNPNGVPSRAKAKQLGEDIGKGNKLVFLSVRSGRPRVRIVNSGQGVFVGGVWHSNHSFERKAPRWRQPVYYGAGLPGITPASPDDVARERRRLDAEAAFTGGWSYDPESHSWVKPEPEWPTVVGTPSAADVTCMLCRGRIVAGGKCEDCTTCQECFEAEGYCMCYTPRSALVDPEWTMDELNLNLHDDGARPAAGPVTVTTADGGTVDRLVALGEVGPEPITDPGHLLEA